MNRGEDSDQNRERDRKAQTPDPAGEHPAAAPVGLGHAAHAYELRPADVSAGASAESRYTQIKICLALGRTDEAWNLAAEQYEKSPSDEQAVQADLEVLFATGRLAESQDLINRLLPSANSRMKSFLYYRKSYLSKNEQTVLADLRSSLIANPRNSDALYRLYTIYFEKKDYRKAQYYLKQVVALNPNNEEYLRKNAELEKLL